MAGKFAKLVRSLTAIGTASARRETTEKFTRAHERVILFIESVLLLALLTAAKDSNDSWVIFAVWLVGYLSFLFVAIAHVMSALAALADVVHPKQAIWKTYITLVIAFPLAYVAQAAIVKTIAEFILVKLGS